jgi:hypothetical protein
MLELLIMLMLMSFGFIAGFVLGLSLKHPAWAIYSLRRAATYLHLAANYCEEWCKK